MYSRQDTEEENTGVTPPPTYAAARAHANVVHYFPLTPQQYEMIKTKLRTHIHTAVVTTTNRRKKTKITGDGNKKKKKRASLLLRRTHLCLDLLSHGSVAAHVDVARRVAKELPHLTVLPADQVLHVRLVWQERKEGGGWGWSWKTNAGFVVGVQTRNTKTDKTKQDRRTYVRITSCQLFLRFCFPLLAACWPCRACRMRWFRSFVVDQSTDRKRQDS